MSISLVEPVKLDTSKNGRRFTEADREAAFHVYLTAGRQNMVKTAQLTRISRQTLHAWASRDNWDARIDAINTVTDSGTAAVSASEIAAAMMPHLLMAGVGRILSILADESEKANQNAQMKAAEWAMGMHGYVVPKQSMSVIQHLTDQGSKTTVSMKDLTVLDPDQLAAWEGSTDEDDEGGEG